MFLELIVEFTSFFHCLKESLYYGKKKKTSPFSPTRPSGPSWSSSRHVRLLFVCLSVPFPCDFFQGLSLALRSHDQFEVSHWPYYHMIKVTPC